MLNVKKASLKFKKQKPKTYRKLKLQTKQAKIRCIAAAGEAEKSANLSRLQIAQQNERKRIIAEKN